MTKEKVPLEKKNKTLLAILDVDDLILKTPHLESWYEAAKRWGLLNGMCIDDFKPFYDGKVAGIPGLIGAENILKWTGHYFKERIFTQDKIKDESKIFRSTKQAIIEIKKKNLEFDVYDDMVHLILNMQKKIPLTVVSSSENAKGFLQAINLNDYLCRHYNANPKTSTNYDPLSDENKYPENMNLYDIFDFHVLGSQTQNADSKSHLYQIALNTSGATTETKVSIFEDSIEAIIELIGKRQERKSEKKGPSDNLSLSDYNIRVFGVCRNDLLYDEMQNAGPYKIFHDGELSMFTQEKIYHILDWNDDLDHR